MIINIKYVYIKHGYSWLSRGANLGYTLKQIAEYHTLSYPAFKASLKSAGYTHPREMALHKQRIETAKAVGMDAKTLKTYCACNGIELNKNKPTPKHFNNIIAATRSRQRERRHSNG